MRASAFRHVRASTPVCGRFSSRSRSVFFGALAGWLLLLASWGLPPTAGAQALPPPPPSNTVPCGLGLLPGTVCVSPTVGDTTYTAESWGGEWGLPGLHDLYPDVNTVIGLEIITFTDHSAINCSITPADQHYDCGTVAAPQCFALNGQTVYQQFHYNSTAVVPVLPQYWSDQSVAPCSVTTAGPPLAVLQQAQVSCPAGFDISAQTQLYGDPPVPVNPNVNTYCYQTGADYYVGYPQQPPPLGPCSDGDNGQGCTNTPEPINPANGNESLSELADYKSGDGRLYLSRTYNSQDSSTSAAGTGWQNNLLGRQITPIGAMVSTIHSDLYSDAQTGCTQGWQQIAASVPNSTGVTATWTVNYYGIGSCQLSNGQSLPVFSVLPTYNSPVEVRVRRPGGSQIQFTCTPNRTTYSQAGTVTCVPEAGTTFDLSITAQTYVLTGPGNIVETYSLNGQLQTLTYPGGYQQSVSYTNGQLTGVTDTFGRALTLSYDLNGHLQQVTTPDGNLTYGYDGSSNLTTVTYPDTTVRTYVYGNTQFPNALTGIIDENGGSYASIAYDALGRAMQSSLAGGVWASSVDYTNAQAPVVTDAFGVARTYQYSSINGVLKLVGISGPPCNTCGSPAAATFDGLGYQQQTTDWNGNVTRYGYDEVRGLETYRYEAYGAAAQRQISTYWDPNFRFPDLIEETGRRTAFNYDTVGNLLSKTITDFNSGNTRTWTYSNYTAYGAPQTLDGPRTDVADVTSLSYYPIVAGDPKSGQLYQVTDALAHVTTFNAYDPSGRATQVTDPNGLVTNMTYTLRGQLASMQVGSELTRWTYDNVGKLQQVTYPNGAYVRYKRNGAHLITGIQDQFGNTIVYAVDAMGNRTSQATYDANGNLVQTHSRIFNALNQLSEDIGALNQISQYTYDGNGNLVAFTDPLNRQTVKAYDALNRLISITDPENGLTQLSYTVLDQITTVVDPRSLITTYTPDALNNVLASSSPDTGNVNAGYDAAGNRIGTTDASSLTTLSQYDPLNRVTQITHADGSQITLTYDQGANGIGHLTGMTDASGSSSWSYDLHGRVIQKSTAVGGTTLVTSYSYDSTGDLVTMTLPSGAQVAYTWTNGQMVALGASKLSGSSGTSALVSNVVYQPFRGAKIWTLGNGETTGRSFDLDGRISADPVESIQFDLASEVTNRTSSTLNTLSDVQTIGYDPVGRVNSYSGNGGPISYSYDLSGNRTVQTVNGVQTTFNIDGASNRVDSITPPLTSSSATAQSATYTYNGLGQRVSKSQAGTVTAYVYDEAGHLIGEYLNPGASASVTEHVWFGDLPVSVLQNGTPYFIHADYLDTPRQIDNSSGVPVWAWEPTPFGDSAPNADPKNSGTSFVYHLRFPGQFADAETGLSYNVFRHYDPAQGRYLQSDPMGLNAGINTYVYVQGNPLTYVDLLGLDLCNISLPGLPNAMLDSAFAPEVENWLALNQADGINLQLASAFRPTDTQASLATDPTATTPAPPGSSLHEAGFAVDVGRRSWNALTPEQQAEVVENAATAGLDWGKNFSTPDPRHFYDDPGDRQTRIPEAQQQAANGVDCDCNP